MTHGQDRLSSLATVCYAAQAWLDRPRRLASAGCQLKAEVSLLAVAWRPQRWLAVQG